MRKKELNKLVDKTLDTYRNAEFLDELKGKYSKSSRGGSVAGKLNSSMFFSLCAICILLLILMLLFFIGFNNPLSFYGETPSFGDDFGRVSYDASFEELNEYFEYFKFEAAEGVDVIKQVENDTQETLSFAFYAKDSVQESSIRVFVCIDKELGEKYARNLCDDQMEIRSRIINYVDSLEYVHVISDNIDNWSYEMSAVTEIEGIKIIFQYIDSSNSSDISAHRNNFAAKIEEDFFNQRDDCF